MVTESINDHIIWYPHPKSNICSRFVHHYGPRRVLRMGQVDQSSGWEMPVRSHYVRYEVNDLKIRRLWQVTRSACQGIFSYRPLDDWRRSRRLERAINGGMNRTVLPSLEIASDKRPLGLGEMNSMGKIEQLLKREVCNRPPASIRLIKHEVRDSPRIVWLAHAVRPAISFFFCSPQLPALKSQVVA
jgi:hypothetical protein